MSVTPSAKTVADVMVRRPKTLAADATVADARSALAHSSVKLLLLVDGGRFRGAVSEIPADADPRDAALTYADAEPPITRAEVTVSSALDRLEHKPSGRLVVLDDQEMLLGLVCLTTDGKGFCGTPTPAVTDSDMRSP